MEILSLEALIGDHTRDNVSKQVDEIHQRLYDCRMEYNTKEKYKSWVNTSPVYREAIKTLNELFKNRFGVTIKICYKETLNTPGSAFPFMPRTCLATISQYLIEDKDATSFTDETYFLKKENGLIKGYTNVDIENVRISGDESNYVNYIHMDYYFLFHLFNKPSPRIASSILFHEFGHIFTRIQFSSRIDQTNQILNNIAISLHKSEPAKNRQHMLAELVDIDSLTKKDYEDLKNLEEPISAGPKLFVRLYNKMFNTALSEHNSNLTGEYLADDFAIKFGYGVEIAEANANGDGARNPSNYSSYKIFDDFLIENIKLILMLNGILTVFSPLIGLMANGLILIRLAIIAYFNGETKINSQYGTLYNRIQRVKLNLIDFLKDRTLDDSYRKELISQIEKIEDLIKLLDKKDIEGSQMTKLANSLFPKDKIAYNTKKQEEILEELASNKLFYYSAKLGTSMENISLEAASVKNRKAAEAFILRILTRILPNGKSVQIYKEKFKNMSDKEFDKYMQDLRDEKTAIVLIVPNFIGKHISLDNNLNIAKEEFNYDFFQRLYIGKQGNNPGYMTPIKYLVVDLPIRRQSQSLIKKISVSDTNRKVDKLTGQLSSTPETKSSRITYPETQLLVALGLDASLVELLKYRGGDIRGFTAMNGMISKYGHANLATLKSYASGVESTNTLSSYLKAMHLKNNLSKK